MSVKYDKRILELAPSSSEDMFPIPDMGLLNTIRSETPKLPDEIINNQLMSWIKDTAECASAPVDYVAISTLVHVGTLIGNSLTSSPWEGWNEPPILWVALVGTPSSGKTPSQVYINRAINEIEKELQQDYPQQLNSYNEKLEVAKDLENALKAEEPSGLPPKPSSAIMPEKPIKPQIVVLDSTLEALSELLAANPRGLIQKLDELAVWFYGMGKYNGKGDSERAQWLQTWAANEIKINRIRLGKPIEVPRASISLIGGVQPDKLESIITGSNDGLSARFLYVYPNPFPPKRPTKTPKPYYLPTLFRSIVNNLPIGREPRRIPFDEVGANLLEAYRLNLHDKIKDCSGHYQAFLGKQSGYVARIALILHIINWASNSPNEPTNAIPSETVAKAIQLSNEYFIPMAQKMFKDSHKPAHVVKTEAMAQWIIKNRPSIINKRDIYTKAKISGIKSAKDAQAVIDELVAANWLIPSPSRAGNTSGRPKLDYSVNPRV